jgi:hypothetical protein
MFKSEIRNKFEILMFKSSRHTKEPVFEMVFAVKTFWSFEFWSFGIVSNFVLRYSNFYIALAPFKGLRHNTGSTGVR